MRRPLRGRAAARRDRGGDAAPRVGSPGVSVRAGPASAKTAKPPRMVYIEFEGHQVAVRSDTPEVLAGVESMYSAMIAPAATRIVGHLEVARNGGPYPVRGTT